MGWLRAMHNKSNQLIDGSVPPISRADETAISSTCLQSFISEKWQLKIEDKYWNCTNFLLLSCQIIFNTQCSTRLKCVQSIFLLTHICFSVAEATNSFIMASGSNSKLTDEERLKLATKLDADLDQFIASQERKPYTEGWNEATWQQVQLNFLFIQ